MKKKLFTFAIVTIFLLTLVSSATTKQFAPDLSRISEPVKGVELIPEQFKTNYGTYTIEKGYWFDVNIKHLNKLEIMKIQ